MRWIIAIATLGFYLATLFGVSCSDIDNSCEQAKSVSQIMKYSHNDDKDDNCTPFCQCTCCSVSIASFSALSPEFSIPSQDFTTKKIVIGEFLFVSNYFGNIWQPPRFNA